MVFTGGDPLKRPDLFDLIRHSVKIGLRTNVTPSATPLLTAKAIEGFKEAGVSRMAISLDGPDAQSHDDFRGIPLTVTVHGVRFRLARRDHSETAVHRPLGAESKALRSEAAVQHPLHAEAIGDLAVVVAPGLDGERSCDRSAVGEVAE